MSQRDEILIYAELLSNVKRVSVACDGPLYEANTASASVSADSMSLTVRNHEIENTLQLPDRVVASEDSAQFLRVQNKSSRCHEWSLPLAPPSGRVTREAPRRAAPEAAATPWTAQDLIPGSSIHCRGCQTTLVAEGKIETWKDLPSENWAEMMEFWHCHKPHDHEHHDDQGLASRGYGANSRLSGQDGVGLVDLTSLLFSQSDCSNINPSTMSTSSGSLDLEKAEAGPGPSNDSTRLTNQGTPLSCNNCHCEIGVSHQDQTSATLFKWAISIRSPTVNDNNSAASLSFGPNLSQCVSAMLMATLSRSACSKTIIIPSTLSGTRPQTETEEGQQLLHIWLFNQDITFTSTKQQPEQRPVSAVKVFYRFVNQAEADKLVESMTSDVQDITLPAAAATQLREELEKSNGYLPKPMRNFAQWRIGLLEKWKGGNH